MDLQSLSNVQDKTDIFEERFYYLKEALLSQKGNTSDLERKFRYAATEVILILNETIHERTVEEDQKTKESYMRKLITTICECAKVDQKELLMNGNTRIPKFLLPRQVHMSFLHKTFGISLSKSAGNYKQDHATCSYSCKVIRNWYQTDKDFRDQYWPVIEHCIKYDAIVKKNRTTEYLNGK